MAETKYLYQIRCFDFSVGEKQDWSWPELENWIMSMDFKSNS